METANCNVVSAGFVWIEATVSDIDLNQFLVRIGIMEIRPDGSILVITFTIPCVGRCLFVEGILIRLRIQNLIKRWLFKE